MRARPHVRLGDVVSDPSQSTQRVRVTSTRRDATTRRDLRPLTREIDEQSNLGEVFVAGLMSAQLRLAAMVLGFGAVGLGGLPLLFLLVPATRSLEIGPIPLPWVILGSWSIPWRWSWRATTCVRANASRPSSPPSSPRREP